MSVSSISETAAAATARLNDTLQADTDCTTLLTKSSVFKHSSVFEISEEKANYLAGAQPRLTTVPVANGVPASKLVIGKATIPSNAANGYISPSSLGTCVQQAKARGWTAGRLGVRTRNDNC